MTDDQMQNVRDDIAFMRALASEGQRTPLLGGAILLGAGLIFGIASIAHWAFITGLLGTSSEWVMLGIWVTAGVAFTILLTLVNRRIGRKPGARSPTNKAAGAAWSSVGISIFFIFLSFAAVSFQEKSAAVLATFPSVIFALYGAGWAVASAMTGKKWLFWLALGSWFAAPILGWLAMNPIQYLVYAGALFLLMSLPGLILLRQEPTDIV